MPQVSVPYNAEGNSYAFRAEHCNVRLQRAMTDVFRRAGLANVTIQSLDVRGLLAARSGADVGRHRRRRTPTVASTCASSFCEAMAEQTGGRAVVRNNDMERQVRPLIEESSFYYLLGVEAPAVKDDGRLHEIQVRVARTDVDVRTRRGYFAPTPDERRDARASSDGDAVSAMAGPLPKADMPLDDQRAARSPTRRRRKARRSRSSWVSRGRMSDEGWRERSACRS